MPILQTTKELIKYLHEKHGWKTSDIQIRRMRAAGTIPFNNPVGRTYLYNTDTIDEWMKCKYKNNVVYAQDKEYLRAVK